LPQPSLLYAITKAISLLALDYTAKSSNCIYFTAFKQVTVQLGLAVGASIALDRVDNSESQVKSIF